MSITLEDLRSMPLVAILRGITPDEVIAVGEALVEAGFRCLEVPMNSPDPLASIERLSRALSGRALVGAGTVLDVATVKAVAQAGGGVIISPNTDLDVIRASKALGLISIPGFFTPSEAIAALNAGADALKLFPAEVMGPAGLKAMRAILPETTTIFVVGGVYPESVEGWTAAGASGFGVGSALYKPGYTSAMIGETAVDFVKAVRLSTSNRRSQ